MPGNRLGFLSERDGEGEFAPYTVSLDTGIVEPLDQAGVLSPDGDFVVFIEAGELWVGSADGSYRERLNAPGPPGTYVSWVPPVIPPGHPLEVRTGESSVDAVIDAVLAGDTDALVALARFEEHPCVLPVHEDYRLPPPPCPDGVAEGTVLEVMVVHGCHPMMVAPSDLEEFLPASLSSDSVRLYAVIETPGARGGEYVALFTNDGELGYGMTALIIGRGGWAAYDGGCRPEMVQYYTEGNEFLLPPPD